MNLQPTGIENGDIKTAHTLDIDLLNFGWVLDAGARGFDFARDMVEHGCYVLSLDPSRDVDDPEIERVWFVQKALGIATGQVHIFERGDATHVCDPRDAGARVVPCITAVDALKLCEADVFDAVKLDAEGSEFNILARWPGPIARQINVSFHDFMHPPEYADELRRIAIERLSTWYAIAQHEATARHGHKRPCHWDSLFVLKDKHQ